MSFNEATEIEWLNNQILPKLIKQQKILKNFKASDLEKFQILKCKFKVVGVEEAFMLTTCYRVAIEYKIKDYSNTLHLFVKKTPELPQELFDSINFNALFTNEILAYKTLMPALQDFGKIDLKIVKFYYGELKKNLAIFITEDFTCNQWSLCKEKVNIPLDHILLAVKYLAEFHAIGFAWRYQNRHDFEKFTQGLKESRYNSDLHPGWAIVIRESKKRALAATQKYEPTVDETFLEKLSNLLGDSYSYGKERVKPREPLVTLCHGDYLRNNVAFKYDDKSGQPLDIMMFDLQTLRISSPMVDLSIFLSLSTYAEVRYKNFREIFSLYSETLKVTYSRLVPGTVPEYLSHNSLLKEYINFLPYSISVCASFLMTLVESRAETSQEMLMTEQPEEEVIQEVMTKGGDQVDRELAHQIKELYELNDAYEGNIFEKF